MFGVAAALGMTACTGDFEDINTNPNKMDFGKIYASSCFEPILYGIGYQSQKLCQYYNNELIQMTAYTAGQTQHIKEYIVTNGNWQTIWDNYARYGGDCQHMITLAKQWNDPYYEALGLILKVYNLSNLADLFGDIPYTEAYQFTANRTPKFESQADLQDCFLNDLDSACLYLSKKPVPSKSGLDKMYGDNVMKWIKFANSLRLRILCRYSGMNDGNWAKIQEVIDNPSKYPVMTSNSDNAMVPFQAQDPYMSFWGQEKQTATNFQGYRFTDRVITMTVEYNSKGKSIFVDPRMAMFGKMGKSDWVGVVSGCLPSDTDAEENKKPSYPDNSFINRADFPGFIMDYSEILFIEAEGVERGKLTISGQTAKTLYEAALDANIEKWDAIGQASPAAKTIRKSDVKTLKQSKLASYDKAAAKDGTSIYADPLELILSQKYLSLFYCGFEQYHEWRRTEYPLLTIGVGTGANDNELPTRLGYPNYTVTSNKQHVEEALSRMGGDNNMHTALDWSYLKLNGSHRNK